MSKVFGNFDNIADFNESARNLLDNNEIDELRTLGDENGLPDDLVQKFIDREFEAFSDVHYSAYIMEENAKPEADEAPELSDVPEDTAPNLNETAGERLKREIKDAKNKQVPTVPIANRLNALCETDPTFAAQIVLPHKSLEKCFSYVEEQARKKIGGGRGWIDDEEVYQMATDYYNLDDAEDERIKEEERKKREEENKKQAEAAKKRAAERAEEAKNNPTSSSRTPSLNSKNAPAPDQMTLWGD